MTKPPPTDLTLPGQSQIERLYTGKPSAVSPDFGSMNRDERAAKHAHDLRTYRDALLLEMRGDIVQRNRKANNTVAEGIDTWACRWYRPEDWANDGSYIGPQPPTFAIARYPEDIERLTGKFPEAPGPAKAHKPTAPPEPPKKIEIAKTALVEAEAKVDVKPVLFGGPAGGSMADATLTTQPLKEPKPKVPRLKPVGRLQSTEPSPGAKRMSNAEKQRRREARLAKVAARTNKEMK